MVLSKRSELDSLKGLPDERNSILPGFLFVYICRFELLVMARLLVPGWISGVVMLVGMDDRGECVLLPTTGWRVRRREKVWFRGGVRWGSVQCQLIVLRRLILREH